MGSSGGLARRGGRLQGWLQSGAVGLALDHEIVGAAGEAIDGSLEVQVTGLTPLSVFLVRVDGRLAGALNTDSSGAAELKLSTKEAGRSDPLPASIDIVAALVLEVTTDTGTPILSGTFVH